ncbi:MAG TPA: hypothetical protein VGD74_04380, partial [Vulgatibacter sp.]
FGAVFFLPAWRADDPRTGAPVDFLTWAPPGITAELRELLVPGDRVFNPQEWGSWFEYEFPEALFAMDARIELYPEAIWDEFEGVEQGRKGWEDRLREWGVTVAVVPERNPDLLDRLAELGWRSVYTDKDGSIALAPGR